MDISTFKTMVYFFHALIPSSGDVRIRLLMELCQRILGGKGMPEDLVTSFAMPILDENEKS